jgi:hypothetical protein
MTSIFSQLAKTTLSVLMLAVVFVALGKPLAAADMPLAAGSPIAGITFDDRPLLLPVQRNFQMAMLTASSELGRSCGKIEAYGWRLGTNEQKRVNQIFNNTVDRMRAQGFAVESKSPTSVSKDVTLFTADREDKHLIFLWSAGEIGLVMVLCETSAPLTDTLVRTGRSEPVANGLSGASGTLQLPRVQAYPGTAIPVKSRLAADQPTLLTRTGKRVVANFTPAGDWVGTYTCLQGTTGATLHIDPAKGEHFEGVFRFYPTPRNPNVPTGKYTVFGEYDADSQRILINPGKWLQRPNNYYNTIMIGSFDPVAKTFSGFFQGVNGCTSFEAKYSPNSAEITGDSVKVKKKKTKAVKKHKKAAKPKPAAVSSAPISDADAPAGAVAPPKALVPPPSGIDVAGRHP